MITVQEASTIIAEHSAPFTAEEVPVTEALGRIIREPIYADRDFPPYDRVTMDGIALHYPSYAEGKRSFTVAGIQVAGAAIQRLAENEGCLEVMTGAILPEGTDTVIRYEDIELENGNATIIIEGVTQGQNVHRQGTDRQQGTLLLKEGRIVQPGEIGVLATVGKTVVKVTRKPSVAIVSTGDELVNIDQTPLAHQIRMSNAYTLQAALEERGVNSRHFHILDDKDSLREQLGDLLEKFDVLMLSGGVSKGKADFVPDALKDLGVEKLFHRIKQRPGKPFWCGSYRDSKMVFAFPGNPVSSFLCFHRYFLPWLKVSLGLPAIDPPMARLAENHYFKPDLTYFLQVKANVDMNGVVNATPCAGGGSGDLANLLESNAFLELPFGRDDFKKGEYFPLYPHKSLF